MPGDGKSVGQVSDTGDTGEKAHARVMAALGIYREGRHYHFRGDRYVCLDNAVAHARQVGTRAPRLLP